MLADTHPLKLRGHAASPSTLHTHTINYTNDNTHTHMHCCSTAGLGLRAVRHSCLACWPWCSAAPSMAWIALKSAWHTGGCCNMWSTVGDTLGKRCLVCPRAQIMAMSCCSSRFCVEHVSAVASSAALATMSQGSPECAGEPAGEALWGLVY